MECSVIETVVASTSLPFEPQVSPERAFQHDGWRQARNSVLKALAEGRLAVLVGESGAGKTLLLREMERTLDTAGVVVRRDGPDSAAELIAPDIVRLVDDADGLDDATLFRLALLGRATVLAVLPHSVDRMTNLPGRVAPMPLAPLSPAEVDNFVAAALAAAGRPADLFGADAVAALATFSDGLPGRLNVLGRASLLQAQLEGVPHVQPEHVRQAAEVLCSDAEPPEPPGARHAEPAPASRVGDGPSPIAAVVSRPPGQRWLRPMLLASSGVVLVVASLGWLLPERPPHPSGEEQPAIAGASPPGGSNRRLADISRWRAPEGPPRSSEGAAVVAGGAPVGSTRPAPETPPLPSLEERYVPSLVNGPTAPTRALPVPAPGSPAPQSDNRIAATGQRIERTAPARREAPPTDAAMVPAMSETFRGTTFNETLGRSGRLQMVVTRVGQGDAAAVRFEASRGLVGAGQLAGSLSPEGRLFASGTLMMGANPFATEIEGTITGNQLVGTVKYTRVVEPGLRPSGTRGSFRLARD
jgi:type II secretory pathway predicted ATPase ExeA